MYVGEPFPKQQRTAYGTPRLTTAADRRASKPGTGTHERKPGDRVLEWTANGPMVFTISEGDARPAT